MPESESREMYLKSIYELATEGDLVPVSLLAKRQGVSNVSATEMVKRLVEHNLIEHIPYKGVKLTADGLQRALTVVRRQRLWGRFLADQLKIPWAQIYDLACRLEHATDTTVTEALAEFLDHPAICPHGHPIPGADGTIAEESAFPLNEIACEVEVEIKRIDQPETALCDYLAERGLLPGVRIRIIDEAPYNGPFTVLMDGKEIILGREISRRILVLPLED